MHCVESDQIRSDFWFVFSRIRTEYGEIRSLKAGKYGPEITRYLGTFHAVMVYCIICGHRIYQKAFLN